MRIALFSTNLYLIPPRKSKIIYAPLWITYYLAENLKKKGHEVFLFAGSDSKTTATLISNNLPSLEKNRDWHKVYKELEKMEKKNILEAPPKFPWAFKWKEVLRENYELSLISELYKMGQKGMFDIIQLHSQPRALHLLSSLHTPVVCTIHDPFSHPYNTNTVKIIYNEFRDEKFENIYFTSISNSQRTLCSKLKYIATIYNGIDIKRFNLNKKPGKYLAFAGRLLPWKGAHIAVQVARLTKKRLKIAGPIPSGYQNYFDKQIKPFLSREITYEGMLTQSQIVTFYQKAEVLLMPILWNEPFGLVMTEAMACGTPVIGFNKGAVSEVVKDGKTGFIVQEFDKNKKVNINGLVDAVKKIDKIDRQECRKHIEKNFTIEKMVDGYEKVYYKILKK